MVKKFLVVGLAGQIGSGKSTIAKYLRNALNDRDHEAYQSYPARPLPLGRGCSG